MLARIVGGIVVNQRLFRRLINTLKKKKCRGLFCFQVRHVIFFSVFIDRRRSRSFIIISIFDSRSKILFDLPHVHYFTNQFTHRLIHGTFTEFQIECLCSFSNSSQAAVHKACHQHKMILHCCWILVVRQLMTWSTFQTLQQTRETIFPSTLWCGSWASMPRHVSFSASPSSDCSCCDTNDGIDYPDPFHFLRLDLQQP